MNLGDILITCDIDVNGSTPVVSISFSFSIQVNGGKKEDNRANGRGLKEEKPNTSARTASRSPETSPMLLFVLPVESVDAGEVGAAGEADL